MDRQRLKRRLELFREAVNEAESFILAINEIESGSFGPGISVTARDCCRLSYVVTAAQIFSVGAWESERVASASEGNEIRRRVEKLVAQRLGTAQVSKIIESLAFARDKYLAHRDGLEADFRSIISEEGAMEGYKPRLNVLYEIDWVAQAKFIVAVRQAIYDPLLNEMVSAHE